VYPRWLAAEGAGAGQLELVDPPALGTRGGQGLGGVGHAAFVSGAGPSLLVLCPRPAAPGALADATEALATTGAGGWRVRQLELARSGALGG